MMGVSVLWSTGDNGVGAEGYCLNSSRDFGTSADYPIFNPSFPATCPYVTSVGATQINISAVRACELDPCVSADAVSLTCLDTHRDSWLRTVQTVLGRWLLERLRTSQLPANRCGGLLDKLPSPLLLFHLQRLRSWVPRPLREWVCHPLRFSDHSGC